MKINLSIGIQDYAFTAAKLCAQNPGCRSQIKFSIKLQGNFLRAALSDDINKTVDYDQLCKLLEKKIILTKDINILKLAANIKKFSADIKSGLLELEVCCPHVYLKDQCLL